VLARWNGPSALEVLLEYAKTCNLHQLEPSPFRDPATAARAAHLVAEKLQIPVDYSKYVWFNFA
jgi:hypothetical protein